MSLIVSTEFGRLRRVVRDGRTTWLLECPGCAEWGELDEDQLFGDVSVNHAADGCRGGYHETHNFAGAILGVQGARK